MNLLVYPLLSRTVIDNKGQNFLLTANGALIVILKHGIFYTHSNMINNIIIIDKYNGLKQLYQTSDLPTALGASLTAFLPDCAKLRREMCLSAYVHIYVFISAYVQCIYVRNYKGGTLIISYCHVWLFVRQISI